MTHKHVLIAGASGLVGYAAVKHFAAQAGVQVTAVSRRTPFGLDHLGIRFVSADLNDQAQCESLFGAMHESVHYGSFKTRWMADLLAFFSGAAILNNAGFYRHYHMAHHRYTQDPARDPELITSGTPRSWGNYLFRVSAIPFFLLRFRDIFLFPFGFRGDVNYIHEKAWPEVRRWGRWLLAFYAVLLAGSLALQSDVLLWVWLIPLAIGAPLLRLYLLCEHTLCPNSDDGFANTRTTLCNPLLRFLMWNLPYHAEHHLLPNIAFHHLPEAHRHLRPHLKFVARSYTGTNREIVRSFATHASLPR